MSEQKLYRVTDRGMLFGAALNMIPAAKTIHEHTRHLREAVDRTQNPETQDGTVVSAEEWESFRRYCEAAEEFLKAHHRVLALVTSVMRGDRVARLTEPQENG